MESIKNTEIVGSGASPEISAEAETQLKGFLQQGDFEGAFTSAASPNAIEKFVERGDKAEDLLMRADFRNDRHVNAAMLLYADAVHFNDKELQETIINVIAARTSIGGKRIQTLLKAVVGQLEAERQNSLGGGLRRAIFGDKKEQPK